MTEEQQHPLALTIEKLLKVEKRLQAAKGVEAKALGTDYILPILRALIDETSSKFAELDERVDEASDGGADADILEDCRNIIVKFAGLMDEVMVAAGFMKVTNAGLVAGNAPGDIIQRYMDLGTEASELVADIEESLSDEDDEDDDGPDGDPGEPAAKPDANVVAFVAAADPVKPDLASVAPALEPDSVEPAEPATAKGGATAVNTEHDTDAA